MKIAAIIEARMGSTRLPGKTMAKIAGKPMLELMIERVKMSKLINEVIVATTENSDEKEIINLTSRLKVPCFQGSEEDVLSRVLKAAIKYKVDIIVELTADCPFADPQIIDEVIQKYLSGNFDHVSNISKRSFPRGLDVQVFPTKVLKKVASLTDNPIDREHVSLYIYRHPKIFKLGHIIAPPSLRRSYRLTVDVESDLELTRRVYQFLYPKKKDFSLQDVVSFLDKNSQLAELNSDVKQKPEAGFKRNISPKKTESIAYRVGIVGCGRISSLFDDDPQQTLIYSHAGALNAIPKTKLVAASDTDKQRLKRFGKRWGIDKLYSSYEEMLLKEELDILVIAVSNHLHYEIIKKASGYPLKAIFCEKPFTDSFLKAKQATRLCHKKNIILAIDHSRRWDELAHKIKEYIMNGEIGKVEKVTIYYTRGIANTGSHLMDLLRFFFGDALNIQTLDQGENINSGTDPSLTVSANFSNGTQGLLLGFDNLNFSLLEFDLVGKDGRIKILTGGREAKIFKTNSLSPGAPIEEVEVLKGGLENMLVKAVLNITDAIEGKREILSTGGDGIKALEMVSAAIQSSLTGNKVVTLPLSKTSLIINSRT